MYNDDFPSSPPSTPPLLEPVIGSCSSQSVHQPSIDLHSDGVDREIQWRWGPLGSLESSGIFFADPSFCISSCQPTEKARLAICITVMSSSIFHSLLSYCPVLYHSLYLSLSLDPLPVCLCPSPPPRKVGCQQEWSIHYLNMVNAIHCQLTVFVTLIDCHPPGGGGLFGILNCTDGGRSSWSSWRCIHIKKKFSR